MGQHCAKGEKARELEEKEKELGEAVEHEIELSERVMELEENEERLRTGWESINQSLRYSLGESRRRVTRKTQEINTLQGQKRDLEYKVQNRDVVIDAQRETIRDLRVQRERYRFGAEELRISVTVLKLSC